MSKVADALRTEAELLATQIGQRFGDTFREGTRMFEAADLLDEAEKALAGLVDCHADFTGEPGHDANVWAEADDKARATLARIRGEA